MKIQSCFFHFSFRATLFSPNKCPGLCWHGPGHYSLGKKIKLHEMKNGKGNFGFLYRYIKYGKFWSILLELFIKHKPFFGINNQIAFHSEQKSWGRNLGQNFCHFLEYILFIVKCTKCEQREGKRVLQAQNCIPLAQRLICIIFSILTYPFKLLYCIFLIITPLCCQYYI